jgi:hypothetical protein
VGKALLDNLATVTDFPDSGDIIEALRTPMTGAVQLLGLTRTGPVFQGVLAGAQSYSATRLPTCNRSLSRPAWHVASVDPQALIGMLQGALYYRLLQQTRPPDPDR